MRRGRRDVELESAAQPKFFWGYENMTTPSQPAASGDSLRARVESVLQEIRPMIQSDGGDIELVDVSDAGEVQVRLQGACVGCPMSQMTMTNGVERRLREQVPEVTKVTQVPPAS